MDSLVGTRIPASIEFSMKFDCLSEFRHIFSSTTLDLRHSNLLKLSSKQVNLVGGTVGIEPTLCI
jgi:hypothetical protein